MKDEGHNYLTKDEMVEVNLSLGVSYSTAELFATADRTLAPSMGYKINTPKDYESFCKYITKIV